MQPIFCISTLFYNIICLNSMQYHVQSHLVDHAAPSISLFIALQNSLNSISSDKPMKQVRNNIFAFVQRLGAEGQKIAISALMEALEQPQTRDKTNTSYKTSLLSQMIKEYSANDNFYSYFPEIVAKVARQNRLNQLIANLMNNLKLPINTQIAIALSLYLSDRSQLISFGQNELINKLKQYSNSEKPVKLPQKLLDQLLFQINISPELSNKLQEQNKVLLEASQKLYKKSEARIYNYYRDQWQYFANEMPTIDKPMPITLKKADILKDLGPSVSQQMDTLKAVLIEIGPINQQDIFECLMMMSEEKSRLDSGMDRFIIDLMYASSTINHNKKNSKTQDIKKVFNNDMNNKKVSISWNIDNFLLYCTQNIQNIKWQNVLSNFDRQNLQFKSSEHFVEIMKNFQKVKKLIKKWSLFQSIFFKKWAHPQSQEQFLYRLLSCKDPQCLFFNETQIKKNQNISKDPVNSLRQIWGYQDLISLYFQVSNDKRQRIKQVFQTAIEKYPDLLLKTLSQIKPNKGTHYIYQIYLKILPQFLQNDTKNIQIMQVVWANNKQLVIKTINTLYKQGLQKKRPALDIEKLVQIFTKIEGSLQELLTEVDSSLTMAIALIAGKKQYISLQRWLILKTEKNEAKFSKEILAYIQKNIIKQLQSSNLIDQKQVILQQANLSIQTLNKIFMVMIQKLKTDHPTSKNNDLFKKLHKQCCKLFPEIAQGQIYEQAQKQCEQQIKKIYKQEITIKDAIQNLKRLKNSSKKQERQNFASRITFLCIQLTYHHSYPEKQLMMTSDLFSALINQNLVQKKIFQMFLHVMIEYLKEDNYQYTFSMRVMQNIKVKLAHESWFCQKLIDNDLVMKKDPQIVQQIINSIQPPKVLSVQKQRKIKQAIKLKKIPIENIQRRIIIQPQVHHQPLHKQQIVEYDILATLDKSKKIQIHDRQSKIKLINTICNTLSLVNVDEKAKQLKKVFDNQKAIKLLAYSLVFKRITITQNNGAQVFVKLLENLPKVQKPVLNITYKVLEKWFNLSGKSASNDKKFSHFKNIASWLGRMTIGKGTPIPIYKLNLKQILKTSFITNNRISYNIPVILKILQYINLYPNIFREHSPWLKRIMCALNEVETNLKDEQQVKTQIKAFFKSSKMNMQAVLLNQPSFLHGDEQCSISQLILKTNLSEEIFKLCDSLQLKNVKMMIVMVLDASIKDIVEPVIERSVKIAKTTTMHMITKDFSTQTNAQKVKQSSICLAKQLAQPLAQITCRQPLKGSITKNLKQKLKEQIEKNKGKQQQYDNLIQKIINQTVDIGCQIIKERVCVSAEKAIRTDPKLIQSLQLRNYLKSKQQAYKDENYLNSIPSMMPSQLKPSQKGITQQQYQIYVQLKKHKEKEKQHQKASKQQCIINLIEQKQSIEKIKKCLAHEQVTEEILEKIYAMVLDENNDEVQLQYYYGILGEIKQVAPFDVWRVFKTIADIQNEPANKILHDLISQKYFDESVLTELEQFEKEMKFFEKWMQLPKQNVKQFMVTLNKQLSTVECNITTFILASLKFVINKYLEQAIDQSAQSSTCFNTNYIDYFVHFVQAYYQSSEFKQDFQTKIQIVLDAISESLLKLPNKNPQISSQRVYFKILTNLIQVVSYQRNQVYLRQNDKEVPQKLQTNQTQLSPEKILIFHKVLSKKLSKINPLARPAFSFAWLELITNKYMIRYLLLNYEDWELYYNLLSQLLRFTNEYVSEQKLYDPEQGEAYQKFYLAIFKLFIVLLHDFQLFLSQFSLYLQLILDCRFVQLKNTINSVYPSNQLSIPLKFQKREDLLQFVQKVGYPKYYKLIFDKNRLNYYLKSDPNDQAFKQKLSQQNDFFVQILVLYIGWLQENGLTQNEAFKKLIDIIITSKEEIKLKLINYTINLIRYPNYITLFFIDFIDYIIFKQTKQPYLRQLVISSTITRMGEVPNSWGLFHVCNNFLNNKKVLEGMNISQQLIQQL